MEYSLEQLKAMALKLGMTTHPNIGAEKLLEKLQDEVIEKDTSIEELADMCGFTMSTDNATVTPTKVEPVIVSDEKLERLKKLTFATAENKEARKDEAKQLREAELLVHVRIVSNDPNKKAYPGEILTVGNAKIPGVKKFIPFGTPYMIPQIQLNALKEKKVQLFRKTRSSTGQEITEAYTVPAYNIEILAPLTREEFNNIKQRQLAAGRDKEEV